MSTDDTLVDHCLVPLHDAIRGLQRRIEELETQRAVDPDGELAWTAQMLALKRGSRR